MMRIQNVCGGVDAKKGKGSMGWTVIGKVGLKKHSIAPRATEHPKK